MGDGAIGDGDVREYVSGWARRDGFAGTDDAVLVERLGGRVALVPGLPQNLKVTTREDLTMARRWMARSGR